jgi:hypothetical protein
MTTTNLPAPVIPTTRLLMVADFQCLADVPPDIEGSPTSATKALTVPTHPPCRTSQVRLYLLKTGVSQSNLLVLRLFKNPQHQPN